MGVSNPTGPVLNLPQGDHKSWIARVLPYLGEPNRYSAIDWEVGAYHAKNNPVRQGIIGILICPSSPSNEYPGSSYAGVHNDTEAPINADNNGTLFLNSKITLNDLQDGASYTLLGGERLLFGKTDLGWLSGTPSTLRNLGAKLNAELDVPRNQRGDGWAEVPPWYKGADQDDSAYIEYAGEDQQGDSGEAESDQADDPNANADPLYAVGGNPDNPRAVGGFGSYHPGAVAFAFADGSVQTLSESTDQKVLQLLANRNDGAILDQNEF